MDVTVEKPRSIYPSMSFVQIAPSKSNMKVGRKLSDLCVEITDFSSGEH